ncbi:hypothetical protein ALQ98_200012 [Pseudomonas syringae pv. lapsa]|uniref:Uncharacterized protein n=1 Tax=Pseudomonas syringae pv. lapsa TaxID=199201 RepID=A0AB74A3W1_PSESX|nr:hypothetical protein ALQ98_200012 [Pseudomonas syringae pv. lapsa]
MLPSMKPSFCSSASAVIGVTPASVEHRARDNVLSWVICAPMDRQIVLNVSTWLFL